jgi:dipeptidyl aminopeptidase/acylaminoacyl peptidase
MPSYRRRSQYCLGHPISHLPELIAVAVLGMIFVGLCRAQQPPKNGGKPTFWIVFDMNPEFRVNPALDIETDVYRMDQYGEHAKRLTSDHRSHHPSWSPDGQQIVFLQSAPIQNPKGTYGYETPDAIYSLLVSRNVFRMDISGRNLVRVSSVGPDAQDVAWLPGGKHLAVRISNRRNLQVFIGPPDSSGEKFAREETFEELLKEGHAAGAKWLYWPRLTEFFPPDDNFLPAFYAPWAGDPDAMTPENFRRIHTFDADKAAFAKVMDLTGERGSRLRFLLLLSIPHGRWMGIGLPTQDFRMMATPGFLSRGFGTMSWAIQVLSPTEPLRHMVRLGRRMAPVSRLLVFGRIAHKSSS